MARERRRDTRLLAEALDAGALRLEQVARLRLTDFSAAAEEVSLHWPHSGLPAASALAQAGQAELGWRIGRWMLEQACRIAGGTPDGPMISVPVPAALLADGIDVEVAQALEGCGLPGARLELRLSETGLLEPTTEQLLALSALRDRGVSIALEDFGMRYGSLLMLCRLPITAVHLDPSLTQDISPHSEEAGVLEGLITVAHTLELSVAARTSHEPSRLAALARLGVDEVLGQRPRGALAGGAA